MSQRKPGAGLEVKRGVGNPEAGSGEMAGEPPRNRNAGSIPRPSFQRGCGRIQDLGRQVTKAVTNRNHHRQAPELVSFELALPVALLPEDRLRSVSPWERSDLHFYSLSQMTAIFYPSWVPSAWSEGFRELTARRAQILPHPKALASMAGTILSRIVPASRLAPESYILKAVAPVPALALQRAGA
jgi:hypothetical protein